MIGNKFDCVILAPVAIELNGESRVLIVPGLRQGDPLCLFFDTSEELFEFCDDFYSNAFDLCIDDSNVKDRLRDTANFLYSLVDYGEWLEGLEATGYQEGGVKG